MLFRKKDCVAMILAGGQGSRLTVLTESTAKPAVPFGGKYRLIDFPLSNCVNSGIDTVGILTQYQPLQLNEYIGNGMPWGLNSNHGGIHLLSPYSKAESSEWYKGTANAIFQNISFIDRYNPTHVLILSGDHIYKMDYAEMMEYHKEKNADCTIAVLTVTPQEASRFGIMNTREDGRIYEFEEKPAHPKSCQASMGIYVFRWDVLKKYLIADNEDPESSNDFGKNIIPRMIADSYHLQAYPFTGYWRDVGTIDSLWQANMDILGKEPALNMSDKTGRIYARNYANPASFVADTAQIEESFVAEGSSVFGTVRHSVISTGCTIEEGAEIDHSFIMPDTVIRKGARVGYAIVGEETVVGSEADIGARTPQEAADKGIAVVGKGREVPAKTRVAPREKF